MTTITAPAGLYARILTGTDGEKGSVFVFDTGTEIDTFTVPGSYADNLGEIEIGAKMFGWRFSGKAELVEAGQYVVPVARIPRDDA